MESKFNRVLSLTTLYPEKSEKLPQTGIIKLPRKYQKIQQISNGSFTSVFCIKDRGKKGTIYAAKFMKDKTKNGNEEVEILKTLQNCEQVPQMIDVFHTDYQTILITEYLAGGNLFERLSDPMYKLTENKCQVFIKQILEGLEYMHSHRIVHLNIMPYSIIFLNKNSDHGLKIIDFGHAVQLSPNTDSHKLNQLQGTLEYLAPEALNCDHISPATDLWSLGVVVYMLVSGGVSPFFSGTRLKTMVRSLKAEYDLNIDQMNQTSPHAKDLITNLLQPEPGLRLTASECLAHRWFSPDETTSNREIIMELETSWMKRCLARRRWYRALNTLKAMHIIRKLSSTEYKTGPESRRASAQLQNMRSLVIEEGLAEPTEFQEFQEKYETIHQIGSGTFGSVYLIRDRETHELAAAKYLRQTKENVRTEAAILQRLIQSAFIVQLVGLYESNLNSVLVTEYLSGGDLVTRTASDDYCLTEKKCQVFIKQIVRGLQFIHTQGIIHLDLKPFNVIFANPDDDYNLRIIDFGIAEQLEPGKSSVQVNMCGTLEYMSPEVMNCQFASFASDMWGVGAITYLLVSGGVSPFWAGSRYRTMAKTLSCDYNFDQPNFSLISESAKDFISELLVLDPEQRMTVSSSLRHPWLTHIGLQTGLSEKEHWMTLETAWMKGILARRRWQRWFHAIKAMHRIRKLSTSHI
eukprot:GFUD01036497.1.p1 GENE.GFUD01036497.1~~GFUD01036497.1.p1  ORF type:complete len:690 (+),score=174.45 GFUD01036497.1:62-2131(+)